MKPPYVLPTMVQARAVPWNGYSVVSTFSGAGGSCLGFRLAGFRTVWASEFVPAARETYMANFPEVPCDPRDVRTVTGQSVRACVGLGLGLRLSPLEEIDVLEGSPPCASFSMSGRREQTWGQVRKYSDTQQRVDDLFFEFSRLVGELRPRVFVAENVSGLVKGVAQGVFIQIMRSLRAHDYHVACRLLDAKWLGVPQSRRRVIFVGVRKDVGQPRFPRPLPYYYTLAEALPHLGGATARTGRNFVARQTPLGRPADCIVASSPGNYRVTFDRRQSFSGKNAELDGRDVTDRPSPCVTVGSAGKAHFAVVKRGGWRRGQTHSADEPAPVVQAYGIGGSGPHQVMLDEYAIGREMDALATGQQSTRYPNLVRAHPERPSPTVTAAGGNKGTAAVVHPSERRKFTIAELKRICAFPEDFVLTGTYAQQWERLGRAVPPVMMYHVAREVEAILREADGVEGRRAERRADGVDG